jgi:UDP-glucose/iron transport system ATP-binding protein
MTSPVILNVNQLKRISSGGDSLVDAASLEICEGDQIALTGASGAGKTVLLRALALLEPIQEGEILWRRKELNHSMIPKYRQDVHYLHQAPVLIEGTVRENLMLPFLFRKNFVENEKEMAEKIEELIQLANKDDSFLDRSSDVLSGGEKQIVALLRSFLVDPSLLLLDEPTSALDADSTRNIESLLLKWINQKGKAYLWISHDSNQQERVSTRQIKMESGRVITS